MVAKAKVADACAARHDVVGSDSVNGNDWSDKLCLRGHSLESRVSSDRYHSLSLVASLRNIIMFVAGTMLTRKRSPGGHEKDSRGRILCPPSRV